ncbi:hypothetical protein [uncultured Hymenobacter sp.]|uniref:hypothetical protein n=1 Tax=uncultured Hymenobacter sp. TaxID=170016 RepID=UPI0035CC8074
MQPIIKTRHKAEETQRRYYWSLPPYEQLVPAIKLNRQAQAIYAANPANLPLESTFADGRRVLKSATPIPLESVE